MCSISSAAADQPLVSVVVATYRQEAALEKALDSLHRQTYPAIEIVVVDDNCDPAWNLRVSSLIRRSPCAPRIRYLRNEHNLGSAGTRNRGIFAARGAYITFLDDDDLYLPEKIHHQLRAMRRAGADFSITDLDNYYDDGRISNYTRRTYLRHAGRDDLLRLHFMYHMTCPDTMMFRTAYLRRIGGFGQVDLGDEFYLMASAIQAGGVFCYVPHSDVQTFVHIREVGLSSGQNKIDGEMQLYAYKQQFLPSFDRASRRCIRMRHYAVLAFGYARLKKGGKFLETLLLSFLSSPVSFVRLVIDKKGSKGH